VASKTTVFKEYSLLTEEDQFSKLKDIIWKGAKNSDTHLGIPLFSSIYGESKSLIY
jgi:hypothetical protein